jgi:hypothetical protein
MALRPRAPSGAPNRRAPAGASLRRRARGLWGGRGGGGEGQGAGPFGLTLDAATLAARAPAAPSAVPERPDKRGVACAAARRRAPGAAGLGAAWVRARAARAPAYSWRLPERGPRTRAPLPPAAAPLPRPFPHPRPLTRGRRASSRCRRCAGACATRPAPARRGRRGARRRSPPRAPRAARQSPPPAPPAPRSRQPGGSPCLPAAGRAPGARGPADGKEAGR